MKVTRVIIAIVVVVLAIAGCATHRPAPSLGDGGLYQRELTRQRERCSEEYLWCYQTCHKGDNACAAACQRDERRCEENATDEAKKAVENATR